MKVPAAFSKLFRTEHDWDHNAEPDPNLKGRSLYIPRGKMLGGSSSMNAMIYIRGRRHDYDTWESMGAKGWTYDEVLPYFRRSEHNETIQDEYHGMAGELNVSDLARPQSADGDVHRCRRRGRASSATLTSTAPTRTDSATSR